MSPNAPVLARLAVVVSVLALSVAGAGTICLGAMWMEHPLAQCCTVGAGTMFFGAASALAAAVAEP